MTASKSVRFRSAKCTSPRCYIPQATAVVSTCESRPSSADSYVVKCRSCSKLTRSPSGLNRTRCGNRDTAGRSARVAKFMSGPPIRMRPSRRPNEKLLRLYQGDKSARGTADGLGIGTHRRRSLYEAQIDIENCDQNHSALRQAVLYTMLASQPIGLAFECKRR